MPIEDFTSRTWEVIRSDDNGCPQTSRVRISGGADKLTIVCGDKTLHEDGKFLEKPDRIEAGDFAIRLQISYRPKDSRIPVGGAWIAEDTTGGAGGDD